MGAPVPGVKEFFRRVALRMLGKTSPHCTVPHAWTVAAVRQKKSPAKYARGSLDGDAFEGLGGGALPV